MPEGPEVRNTADKLTRILVDRPVEKIIFSIQELKPFEKKLIGKVISAVETYGKATLLRFANGLNIYSHNHMVGKWRIHPLDSPPSIEAIPRLAIYNSQHKVFLYYTNAVSVLTDERLSSHSFLSKLGPDLLNAETTFDDVLARFKDLSFAKKRLSQLLLDQTFLAGPGNYLRSEILFVAKIHPQLRLIDCTAEQVKEIARATWDVIRQAYKTQGVTLDLEIVAQLKERGKKRGGYRHYVFGRQNQPCYICGTKIIKEMYEQRRCYLCPVCQKP